MPVKWLRATHLFSRVLFAFAVSIIFCYYASWAGSDALYPDSLLNEADELLLRWRYFLFS